MSSKVIWLILTILITFTTCANIAIFGSAGSSSHMQIYNAVAKVLAGSGHNITVISPYVIEGSQNVTMICPKLFQKILSSYKSSMLQDRLKSNIILDYWLNRFDMSISLCRGFVNSEELQDLLKWNIRFDLIMINPLFGECGLALGYFYSAPTVYLGSAGMYSWITPVFGNPSTILHKSNILTLTSQNVLDFSQRFCSTFALLLVRFTQVWYAYPKTEEVLRERFGSGMPSIVEMERNVSLMFLNSNIGVEPPVPYMPNVVEIAGIHCRPANQLTKEFSEFVDASSGIILFSLGSLVKAADMPLLFRNALLDAFSQLPYKVIWKWDDEQMDGVTIPNNVMITTWMPQNDLLGHNKTKLFITHGGKQSTIESLYHGVPVVVVPVFSDQDLHAFLAQERGYGVVLTINEMELSTNVLAAIRKVIDNPQYKLNAKKYSLIMADQPLSPEERVTYWTNYVLRHKNIVLKIQARNNSLIEYMLWDVILIIILVISVAVGLYLFAFKLFVHVCKKGIN